MRSKFKKKHVSIFRLKTSIVWQIYKKNQHALNDDIRVYSFLAHPHSNK